MKDSIFWIGLFVLSLIVYFGIIGILQIELIKPYGGLYYLTMAFMAFSTILFYILGKMAIHSSNPYAFIQLVIAGVMFKIVGALVVVGIYVRFVEIQSKFYLLPFIVIYIVYTIFETTILYKLALKNPSHE